MSLRYAKAWTGLAVAGISSTQVKPIADWITTGLNAELAQTAFGAMPAAANAVVSGVLVGLLTGLLVAIIPNKGQGGST